MSELQFGHRTISSWHAENTFDNAEHLSFLWILCWDLLTVAAFQYDRLSVRESPASNSLFTVVGYRSRLLSLDLILTELEV